MTEKSMRNVQPLRTTLVAALAVVALGGCHRNPSTKNVVGGEATKTKAGIIVSNARLVLPAVPGHPGVLYMNVSNQSAARVRVVAIDVAGAQKAELHETTAGSMEPLKLVPIETGRIMMFAPGGKHVMVFGLKPAPKPGANVDITLHFFDGKTFPAQAKVETAGGDDGPDVMGAMPGMAMPGTLNSATPDSAH